MAHRAGRNMETKAPHSNAGLHRTVLLALLVNVKFGDVVGRLFCFWYL